MKKPIFVFLFLLTSVWSYASPETDQADKYWQKAETLAIAGKYSESLEYYQRAYKLVEKIDPNRAANLCNDISSAYYGDGNYKTSLKYCYKGLSHISKKNSTPDSLYFKLYSSLGTMHNALEQRDSSYYYFQSADAVLDRSPNVEKEIPLYVLHHYLHQGRAFWTLHRYHQSIAYFTKAKSISEIYHLPEEEGYIQSSLAEVYDLLGKHREALEYRLAAANDKDLPAEYRQKLYSGLAYTYQKMALPDSALHWHKMSWKQHLLRTTDTDDFKNEYLKLLFLIGSCYQQKGQLNTADDYLNQALVYHARNLPNEKWMKAAVLMAKGGIAQGRFQYPEATAFYQMAFRTVCTACSLQDTIEIADILYPETTFLILYLQATLLSEQYRASRNSRDLVTAYQSFKKLIDLKRSAFYDASMEADERQFLSKENYDIFKAAIPIAYELYQKNNSPAVLQEVFNWFEDANASYLFDVIRDKNLLTQKIPREILEQEQSLIRQRATLASSADQSSEAVRNKMADLRLQWYKLRQTIKDKYTSGSVNLHEPIQISHVQEKLDKKSAYVSYKWFEDQVYAFVITKEKVQLTSWKINSGKLAENINNLQREFGRNPGFGNYNGSPDAIECHKILLEPLKKWIVGKNRLIIARDWKFNFLPLEILETGRQTNDYVAMHYAISYTYSAALFWKHPSLAKSVRYPVFNFNDHNSGLVIAPFVKQQAKNKIAGWDAVSSLDDLSEIGGKNLWGERATKQEFLKSGFDQRILHFATHAEADDENPNDSFIQFYPGNDSKLYLGEIYSLPLTSTRLTLLSACSAGKGKNIFGEGNISLAHSIAQAGCPSVVTTIWEANDEVISFLSRKLYKYLKKGHPVDEAIQMARLDFFAEPAFKKFAHPYYWANLMLIGNNEPIYPASIFLEIPISAISGGSLIILISLLMALKLGFKAKKSRIDV